MLRRRRTHRRRARRRFTSVTTPVVPIADQIRITPRIGAHKWHNSGASFHWTTTIPRGYDSAASPAVALARLDRVAVVTSRLDAFLAFAHVDHRVDQPHARDHHEDRYRQHDEIGPSAIVLAPVR